MIRHCCPLHSVIIKVKPFWNDTLLKFNNLISIENVLDPSFFVLLS